MRLTQPPTIAAAFLVIAFAAAAQTAPTAPAEVVSAFRLKQLGDSITPGASRTAQIGRGPNFTYALTHRDSSGGLERHDAWTDILVIQSGSATYLSGGIQEGATAATPGEWRGGTARGATRQRIAAGDVVTVPAGTPHQFILSAGEQITYIAFKVAAPPPTRR
jgi:hypothetical protein